MKSLIYIISLAAFLSCTTNENSVQTAEVLLSGDYLLNIEHSSVEQASFFGGEIIKRANWPFIPDIIICDEMRISRTRIEQALKFWENLGYKFGEIITMNCPANEQFLGSIYIMPPQHGYDFAMLSNTHTAYALFQGGTKKIVGAWIEMPSPNINRERILEHEIGHTLGFQHTVEKYHMMNKDDRFGGDGSAGLNIALH